MQRENRRLAAIVAADIAGYSRLIGLDEEGTLRALRAHRAELIDALIEQHGGRVANTAGDSLLLEFPSAVDAVRCSIAMQEGIAVRNRDVEPDHRISFRIGINVGDVVVQGDDLLGDGVNIAARMEGICEPGGMTLSDDAYRQVRDRLDIAWEDDGEHEVKNIARPVQVWRWHQDVSQQSNLRDVPEEQQISFCTAPDGCTIAYASIGNGPPVVRAPHWLNHLEYDWESPVYRHLLRDISRDHKLVRFDQRGNGLSDWRVPEFSFEAMVNDLSAVVDAAGLEKFALLGISQGCPIAISYAVRNAERVSHMILYGGFAKGSLAFGGEDQKQRIELFQQLILQGWGKNIPTFRQFFTSMFIPGATKEQMDWFNELQRITTTGENASRLVEMAALTDVTDLLSQITVPTLVLHRREDQLSSFKLAQRMAAAIPNARFVALEGQNHMILEDEPAWPRFLEEVLSFLAEDETAG